MADRIATREFCNTLKTGSFGSDLKRCPTRGEIVSAGLIVGGTYGDDQLVKETDIRAPVEVIVCGDGGYIERISL